MAEVETLEVAYHCNTIDEALEILNITPDHINQEFSNDGVLSLTDTRNIDSYEFQINIYRCWNPDTVCGIGFFITFSDEAKTLVVLGDLYDACCAKYGNPEANNLNRIENAMNRNSLTSNVHESWSLTEQTRCSISAYPFSNPEEYQISIQYLWQPENLQIKRG